jgi:hypothetical protein
VGYSRTIIDLGSPEINQAGFSRPLFVGRAGGQFRQRRMGVSISFLDEEAPQRNVETFFVIPLCRLATLIA